MSLEVIIGPMFSGKSTRILEIANRYAALRIPTLVVKPRIDNRFSCNEVVTHNGRRIPCLTVDHLTDVDVASAHVILIEEAQFFDDLVDSVHRWVNRMDKRVYVIGLSGDSDRKPFGQILQCIPMADKVEMLHALCHRCADGTPAPFTHRIADVEDQQVYIGGAESFIPLCRDCYNYA